MHSIIFRLVSEIGLQEEIGETSISIGSTAPIRAPQRCHPCSEMKNRGTTFLREEKNVCARTLLQCSKENRFRHSAVFPGRDGSICYGIR